MQTRNRLLVPQRPNFIIKLISYGHDNGPLDDYPVNEKARLSFSVRDVPNPPPQLRRKHSGASEKVKKEIFTNKAAQGRLDQILDAIEAKMIELEEDRSREPSPEPEAVLQGPEPPRVFVVGVMCEGGRHRSVSFVDEISKNDILKRKNWEVKVEHRDLGVEDGEEYEDEESEEEVTSPSFTDPMMKKQMDKRRKKMRAAAIGYLDGE